MFKIGDYAKIKKEIDRNTKCLMGDCLIVKEITKKGVCVGYGKNELDCWTNIENIELVETKELQDTIILFQNGKTIEIFLIMYFIIYGNIEIISLYKTKIKK